MSYDKIDYDSNQKNNLIKCNPYISPNKDSIRNKIKNLRDNLFNKNIKQNDNEKIFSSIKNIPTLPKIESNYYNQLKKGINKKLSVSIDIKNKESISHFFKSENKKLNIIPEINFNSPINDKKYDQIFPLVKKTINGKIILNNINTIDSSKKENNENTNNSYSKSMKKINIDENKNTNVDSEIRDDNNKKKVFNIKLFTGRRKSNKTKLLKNKHDIDY